MAGITLKNVTKLYFGDRLVNQVDVGDRDIAMVFQNYGLYAACTCSTRRPGTRTADVADRRGHGAPRGATMDLRQVRIDGALVG